MQAKSIIPVYNATSASRTIIAVAFYDITTLYFEASDEDDLRRMGFSKDGKAQNPQILLALLAGIDGQPLAYEVFEGDKFEGHTLIPVVQAFKKKYNLPITHHCC